MPGRSGARRVRRTYEFIKAHRDEFDVRNMWRVLDVARAAYYAWLRDPQSDRAKEDMPRLRLIRASYQASHGVYGALRVFLDLREAGETCSLHRVERLMRENGIRALHGYRTRYRFAAKPSAVIPDLVKRNFDVIRPNKVWVTDITYIRTWEGWLYLAVVMDLFSRKVIGWAVAPTLPRELVLEAVVKAVRSRRAKETVIHSDQGLRYGSYDWRRLCQRNRLEPSMNRRGNCWDNAVAESFFANARETPSITAPDDARSSATKMTRRS
jgi:putative transposase